mgnify:FL=1
MQDLFLYDNATGSLRINEYGILLVKEFKTLWDPERNKCKEDPKGLKRLRAWKEFKYIWLMIDWKSPYQQYLEQERHLAALEDSGLTDDEWNDPGFRAACRKYQEIKDSSRILSLIKTAYRTLEKMRVSLDNIDFEERDNNLKPIFKPKDVLADIASIGTMADKLKELELSYKKDLLTTTSKNRGDVEEGFDDE